MQRSIDTYDTEERLIAGLRDVKTRESAFVFLVHEYQERLYWHIRQMLKDHDETDDVLQVTFVKAWQNLDRFRGESKIFTWLYRIATNEALAAIKKIKRKKTSSMFGDEDQQELAQLSGSVDPQDGAVIERKLQAALEQLPDKQRLVFQLKYFEEMKYEEMSEVLETSVGALKASYHHAVKKIEKLVLVD